VLVKKPEQLNEIDGLVIPGGESGTFLKLLGKNGFAKLKDFDAREGRRLARARDASCWPQKWRIRKQAGLGALDITVRRNAYGRQIDSSIREGRFLGKPIEMVFIRAPKIERVGEGVEVIATEGREGRSGDGGAKARRWRQTFHPELSDDPRIHQYFLELVVNRKRSGE